MAFIICFKIGDFIDNVEYFDRHKCKEISSKIVSSDSMVETSWQDSDIKQFVPTVSGQSSKKGG